MVYLIIILESIAVIVLEFIYLICKNSSEPLLEIHNRKVLEEYSGSISYIIDKIQLLSSECPMNIDYIMNIYDQIVLINNKYICNKLFDIGLIIKLLNIWGINRGEAMDQLVNFKDIDNEFKALSKIINNINKKLSAE